MSTVFLSVGDASGDLYAADFVRALSTLRPGSRFLGMGGESMRDAGVEIVVDQREIAVSGLLELLPDLHRIVGCWRRLSAALRATRPDLLVLVDSSGFNLPFARRARRLGIPTLYYVSPQAWAWRRGRIRKIAQRIDRLAVILPFETDLYARQGLAADFVGHPLIDRIDAGAVPRELARKQLDIAQEARVVALLPGSRRGEIRHVLPLHLEVVAELHARDPRIRFVLPCAASLDRGSLEAMIHGRGLPESIDLTLVEGRAHEVLRAADAALGKPGTSTLEAALLGCPMVVAARASRLTAWLLRRLVKIDSYVMPNLIAGERVIPEFLQEEARADAVADALLALLRGPARERQLEALRNVRQRLGEGGAAERAATIAAEMLRERLAA
jgi:lipid-A-disaccharide synthase